jgi:ATP-dependent HslUV protease subunit HslV
MGGKIVVGFAGATADAFSLLERFEATVKRCQGNLRKAAVELAKEWRTDRILRRLNSVLLAVDKQNIFLISGSGDVIEPDEGVAAVGSGAAYALAAARALLKHSKLDAKKIVEEALNIVANICVYTNADIHVEVLE